MIEKMWLWTLFCKIWGSYSSADEGDYQVENVLLNIDDSTLRIKPTSAHDNMWIYYILIVVNLHISVTFCGHLQVGVFVKHILKRKSKPRYKIFTLVWFYSHSEASVHGHEVFKIDDSIHSVIQESLKLEGFSVLAFFSFIIYIYIYLYIYIQGVPGGMWNTSGECSLS